MVRQLATIILGTLLALTASAGSLNAQGRGRGHQGGAFVPAAPFRAGVARGVFVPAAPFQAGVARPAFAGRVGPAPFAPRIVGAARIVRPHAGFVLPQVYGGGFYSPYYWPPVYSVPSYPQTYVEPSVSQNELSLAQEVDRLSREIEQLRQEQAAAAARQLTPPPPPPPAEPETPPPPTILVFRDGHRLNIQNYAIIGQTLWVLDEQNSNKIPLSDLDLDATQKENRAQGTRFTLPAR